MHRCRHITHHTIYKLKESDQQVIKHSTIPSKEAEMKYKNILGTYSMVIDEINS